MSEVSAKGLYELIGFNREFDLEELDEILLKNDFTETEIKRLSAWVKEFKFWKEYGEIYFNLEKAHPYTNLSKEMGKMLEVGKDETWLDIGCGPLRVSELIFNKSKGQVKMIEAMDVVLKPAREKLSKVLGEVKPPININYGSITDPLPYTDHSFDGIGANLVLSYIIDFLGKTGKAALEEVLKETFRVLKPGGTLVWSTPKDNVQFTWVFLASIPDMLNFYYYIKHRDFSRILQGTRILKHALEIQKKGREGIYTFLPKEELSELLYKIGFTELVWKKTFAQQVWVIRARKPW